MFSTLPGCSIKEWRCKSNEYEEKDPSCPIEGINEGCVVEIASGILDEERVVDLIGET
jgi:hypothetical protein